MKGALEPANAGDVRPPAVPTIARSRRWSTTRSARRRSCSAAGSRARASITRISGSGTAARRPGPSAAEHHAAERSLRRLDRLGQRAQRRRPVRRLRRGDGPPERHLGVERHRLDGPHAGGHEADGPSQRQMIYDSATRKDGPLQRQHRQRRLDRAARGSTRCGSGTAPPGPGRSITATAVTSTSGAAATRRSPTTPATTRSSSTTTATTSGCTPGHAGRARGRRRPDADEGRHRPYPAYYNPRHVYDAGRQVLTVFGGQTTGRRCGS